MAEKRIFLSPPHMCGREQEMVAQAFADNYIAPVGPHINAFEQEFQNYINGGYAAAVTSGTAALHLALELSGVGPGDEVICSDFTFIASVVSAVHLGARPIFIDADPATWNLDPTLLAEFLATRESLGKMPKALILVHIMGQAADLDPVVELCEKHNITLIEDAAESLGAIYKGRHPGTYGRFGAFSFNGNKIITTGGGGMLLCRDETDMQRAKHLATQARDPAPHYEHSAVGYNFRMSNVLAGIGRGQLTVLPERVEQKHAIYEKYVERLGDMEMISFMPEAEYGRACRWLTCALFGHDDESGYDLRERVRLALEDDNIESRPLWKPMHMQPVFRDAEFVGGGVGNELFQRGLCLPSGTALTDSDLDRICTIIRTSCSG